MANPSNDDVNSPVAIFRKGLGRHRPNEEFGQMNVQRLGDALEQINCRVFRLPLKTGQIGAVNAGLISQFLLRNAAANPNPTHIPSHKCTSFHVQSMP